MDPGFELLVTLALLFAAAGVLVTSMVFSGRVRVFLCAGAIVVIAILALRTYLRLDTDAMRLASVDYPIAEPHAGYVSSDACKACHPREYVTWHSSFHRTMTQRPSAATVRGLFDVSLTRYGETVALSQSGDQFWVDMPAPDWWHQATDNGRIRRPVALMTGSHNYQVYWLSTGNSTMLAQLPYVYLIAEQMWVPRQSVFMLPPNRRIVTEYGRWNTTCIQCHTTNPRPRVSPQDPDNIAFSEVTEFGIACEACHGPGASHVERMRSPLLRYAAHLGLPATIGMVNPSKLPAERSIEVCGQCHSVHDTEPIPFSALAEEGRRYHPGDRLRDTMPMLSEEQMHRDPGHFWPDGMYRVTGREYHGIKASPCFASGKFTCLTCHEPHKQESDSRSLEQWRIQLMRDFNAPNEPCLGCHQQFREAAQLKVHTHHGEDSTGSACINCHMPNTVYGLGKATRSHQISSPSLRAELDTGRPNACNLCHVDRPLAWTGRHLHDWYGAEMPTLDADRQHIAAALYWAYRGDANQRALAIWALGWAPARAVAGQDWVVPHLQQLLDDPYHVLGLVAWRALRKISGFEDLGGEILMVSPSRRGAAAADALASWPPAKPNPEVLIGPDGKIDLETVKRLQTQRDDRPVTLYE